MAGFEEYKLVVLGAGGVGKSSLTIQLVQNHFVEEYDPTIEDSYRKRVSVDKQACLLDILDTAPREEVSALMIQYILNGDGFLCVYSITSRWSFEQIDTFRGRVQEVKKEQQPIIALVGNKCDLEGERQVSKSEGKSYAAQYGCHFFETSAKQRLNVDEAFFTLVRNIRDIRSDSRPPLRADRKKGGCALL